MTGAPALPPRCAGCRCGDDGPVSPVVAIVAHGQPGDPGALQPEIEALAASVSAALGGGIAVAGATLACPRSLARLAGIRAVYPLFMADGWFVRTEMPRRLAGAGVEGFAVLAPLGLDPALPPIGAAIARQAAADAGIAPADATLVVVGHGSKGARASAESTRAFAAALPGGAGFAAVEVALLEEPPFLSVFRATGPAVCLPFFATAGGHTTEDIPEGWDEAGAPGPIALPLGTTPAIPALIAAAIKEWMAAQAASRP